jgi:hypothetical protein
MTAFRCAQCGAEYKDEDDSCSARFDRLLALDHSRQEPWGSRHGQAFAAFALQHPTTHASSLDHAWHALYRIYVAGEAPTRVFTALRARPRRSFDHETPPRPAQRVETPSVTIVHLADFAADTYSERLDDWCRASLASWGLHSNSRETT